PCTMNFVYFSPQNYAPAYPWKLRREHTPMARSWMPDAWGDDLETTIGDRTLGEYAQMLSDVAARWAEGIPAYQRALGPITAHCREAREELDVSLAFRAYFQSCANCYAFADAVAYGAPTETLLALIDDDRATCEEVLPILDRDARIGWHDDLD